MTVSVIIPTWNSRAQLARCLASLGRQTTAPTETLVVDNGSSDGTSAWLRAEHSTVRVLSSSVNRGFAGGVNLGAREASGDVLWIVNDDVVLDSRCLEELLAGLARPPGCAACSAKILRLGPDGPITPARYDAVGDYLTWTGFLYHLGFDEEDRGQYDHLRTLFSPKGVCFVVRRAVFEDVGRFDEAFMSYFEESDLFWRVWLAGHRVGFAAAAVTWHEGGVTTRRLPPAVVDACAFRNRIAALIKNLGGLRLSLILPVHLMLCAAISLAYAARGKARNAAAVLGAMVRPISSWRSLVSQRRHVQQVLRRVPDRALFRQHARAIPAGQGWRFFQTYLRRW